MIYSKKELHDIQSGLANILLVIGSILLTVYLVAPVVGGVLLPNALIICGSYIVFALCMKVDARRIKANEKIDLKTYIPIASYGAFCMLMWFPYPYNIVAGIIFLLISFAKFMTEKKQTCNHANTRDCA